MAKIVVPLEQYQEALFEEIVGLFPSGHPLFVAGIAREEGNIRRTGLKEKIAAKHQVVSSEGVEKFKEDAMRLKVSFNIYYSSSLESKSLLEENSQYADFTLLTLSKERRDAFLTNEIGYDFLSPVLLSSKRLLETQTIVVPVLDNSCVSLLRQFALTIPHFLKSRKVIVMASQPENENEIQKEKFLIEFLRSNLPIVSFCWFNSEDPISEIVSYLHSSGSPSMMVLPKAHMNSFKEYLDTETVSIFTGN